MNLQSFTLQIFDPKKTLIFYTQVLGFTLIHQYLENDVKYYELGLKNSNFYIRLKYDPTAKKTSYQEKPNHNYWKYSLFVADIQKIYHHLQAYKIKVGEPFQFGDIGYLSHTTDTENHKIEYIQKTFKQNGIISTEEETALGLLTIRTKDPVKIIKFYEEVLDLKLFVRMYVDRGKGFTLYFLGDKNLQVPNPDIDAIENREWMYQQSHLFIEIQYYWNSEQDADFQLVTTENNGLQSISFTGNLKRLKKRLKAHNIPFGEKHKTIYFRSLDGHFILVKDDNRIIKDFSSSLN
jgi:catechol 2,3-dioxygenase-like lactoylglutathione lyase family enzyme